VKRSPAGHPRKGAGHRPGAEFQSGVLDTEGRIAVSTVLIVDDDENIRKLISRLLQKEGLSVIEATNGNEGVKYYKTKAPEIVVIDIIMPEKDGLAAIREIKALNNRAKVVAISGGLVMTPQAYLDEAEEISADYVLPKPIERLELVGAVRNLLN
jgi:CheY-like chemotaxis protein